MRAEASKEYGAYSRELGRQVAAALDSAWHESRVVVPPFATLEVHIQNSQVVHLIVLAKIKPVKCRGAHADKNHTDVK